MENSSKSRSGAKLPPQNIDAEKSVLGAILISGTNKKPKKLSVITDISEIITPADFYTPAHATIFQAMLDLYDSHQPIDILTLTSHLKKSKELSNVGGAGFLAELTNFVPTAAHAKSYAELIYKEAVRRRLITAGENIATKAYEEGEDVKTILGEAEKELFEVSDRDTKSDIVSMEELLNTAFDRLEELQNNKGMLRGLKTGFADLDHKTAGLQKGDLIIVGARPAMGKTTFAQNLAYNVASINKKGVLFLSLEMGNDELIDRMISDASGVDNWKIRTGNFSSDDFGTISQAMSEMAELPLYFDETSGMTISDIRNKVRRAAHEHDIGLLIIDYLQLILGTTRYAGNRVQEVTEISRGLKTLAKELKIPVVALAQLNRGVTDRDNPRPVLSDIRESGSIEQDADMVMFLHRPDYYEKLKNPDTYEETHITELLISKHRHGPVGVVNLYFHPELLRFQSVDNTHQNQ